MEFKLALNVSLTWSIKADLSEVDKMSASDFAGGEEIIDLWTIIAQLNSFW